MKKRIYGLAAGLLVTSALLTTDIMAQEKKMPTLEDLIPGGENYHYAENKWYQWQGDEAYWELGIENIVAHRTKGAKAGEEFTVITLEEANKILADNELGKLRHFYNAQAIDAPQNEKNKPSKPLLLLNSGKYRILMDWEKKELLWKQPRPQGAANEDWNKTSRHLAYTVGNNLYVLTADGNTQQVTNEPEGIVCGQSVHRSEFGITKGTFWNPQGELLAFYRMDESMVTQYPLVDITTRIGQLKPVRYPMAGMTIHKVQVGIYNLSTGQTIYLKTGDPTDRYFSNIAWAPDGKSLYLIELNRDQNHAQLRQYDAATGEPINNTLIEEKHPKYVEPMHPIVFLPWDDTKFIYQSQRDGFNHLYLADTRILTEPETGSTSAGTDYSQNVRMKQLTTGSWLVQDIVGFNAKKKEIIFTATKESPLQSNIYKVNVANGKITRLDNGEGIHSAMSSSSGEFVIDRYSTPTQPRVIALTDTRTLKSTNLLVASSPYENFVMPVIETGTIKSADGVTDLYYRIIKPANLDTTQKHPAVIYVYGGPHAQLVTNGWLNGARGWDIYMANQGYIMFSLDNRGSENRGLEFENATFRQLGIEECKDQVKGVEFLQSLPYVDAERIGVHGWSFGGHMTTALMLRYPELFKVGVAGGPVIDWSYYEAMYGERYMDTPQDNAEGYETCNLKKLAGNLKGHLLIIHDDQDETCVPQHTLSFMKACIDARTYPDLFIYPTHKHNVLGRDRVHLHEKITRYFKDYLK